MIGSHFSSHLARNITDDSKSPRFKIERYSFGFDTVTVETKLHRFEIQTDRVQGRNRDKLRGRDQKSSHLHTTIHRNDSSHSSPTSLFQMGRRRAQLTATHTHHRPLITTTTSPRRSQFTQKLIISHRATQRDYISAVPFPRGRRAS